MYTPLLYLTHFVRLPSSPKNLYPLSLPPKSFTPLSYLPSFPLKKHNTKVFLFFIIFISFRAYRSFAGALTIPDTETAMKTTTL